MRIVSLAGLVLAVALAVSVPRADAAGGMLSVAPITMEFAPGKRAIAVEIANPGDEPTSVQLRMFNWRTDEAGDHYEPTQDIGFSPPIFELAPKARQLVRLVLLAPQDGRRERAYRLFVDQLPKPDVTGVQMPIRMVLPVFIAPQPGARGRSGSAAEPKASAPPPARGLQWAAQHDGAGHVILTARNLGERRIKLLNLNYSEDGQTHPIQPGLAGYVLSGEMRGWALPATPKAGSIEVVAQSEDGEVRANVALSAQ